jgi:hypothetical protein
MTVAIDQLPHSFSTAALDYISQNASLINQVASKLGVSAEAVSGSIARKITRSDLITKEGAVVRLRWRASLCDPSSLRDELAHHIGFESLDAAFVAVA